MILVFGRNGQLGRELVDASSARGQELAAVSRHEGDIADISAVARMIDRYQPTIVVNAAAYTDVDRAETDQTEADRTNSYGPGILAKLCQAAKLPLIHLSTDYVFDGQTSAPYRETDTISPLGTYGKSKAAGERSVMAETDHFAIIRTAWLFSKYGRNFLKTMLALAGTREEIMVVADQHGSPTSARSLASALLDMAPLLVADKARSGIYHFAGHPITTWHGFASHIVSVQAPMSGRRPKVTAITTAEFGAKASRPMNSGLDCEHIKRVFGIQGSCWRSEATDIIKDILLMEKTQTGHVA